MRIYVVNGAPGSGKTTFETLVREKRPMFCHILSTVDFVKKIARECGWDGTKDARNRKFLSDLKDLLTEWNDVPFKDIERKIRDIKGNYESYDIDTSRVIVFIDCREPQEIKKLCEGLGAKSLLVRRESAEQGSKSNHADAEVLNYSYDIIIDNNGTMEDLAREAIKFIE